MEETTPTTIATPEPPKKAKRRICNLKYRKSLHPTRPVSFTGGVHFDPRTGMLPKEFFPKWRKRCRTLRTVCRCTPVGVIAEVLTLIPAECEKATAMCTAVYDAFAKEQVVDPDDVVKGFAAVAEAIEADGLKDIAEKMLRSPHLKACPCKNGCVKVTVTVPMDHVESTYVKLYAPGEKELSRDDLVNEALEQVCSLDGATHNVYEDVPDPTPAPQEAKK